MDKTSGNKATEEIEKPKKFFTFFTVFNIVLFLSAIFVSFYFFYFKKDFDFLVEVSCDPSVEVCSIRDCSIPDSCPPNELDTFKRYILKAYDFNKCENEDCKLACEGGLIECMKVECVPDEEMGETCSGNLE